MNMWARLFSTAPKPLSAASKARKAIPSYLRPRASQPSTSSSSSNTFHGSPSAEARIPEVPIDLSKAAKGKRRADGLATLKLENWAEPPLVAQARAKSVKQRNVWESYLVLPAKTRLYISLGLFVFALVGLYAGDYLVPETEEEKRAREEKEYLEQLQKAAA